MLISKKGKYKIILCKDTSNKRRIIFEKKINKSDILELISKYKPSD